MSTSIVKSENNYHPITRSETRKLHDASQLLLLWKEQNNIISFLDEMEYMKQFDGNCLDVYQPEWYSNRHSYYQGRKMYYKGQETFLFGNNADDHNKMFVIKETDEWLYGFQFIHHIATSQHEQTGFFRLLMNVVHK